MDLRLDQRATSAHCWPAPPLCHLAPELRLTPGFFLGVFRHHLGMIDISIINLTSMTRSSGRKQNQLLATHGQFRGDLCARLPWAAPPTGVGSSCHSPHSIIKLLMVVFPQRGYRIPAGRLHSTVGKSELLAAARES